MRNNLKGVILCLLSQVQAFIKELTFSNQSIVIIKGHNLPKNYNSQILVLHMDGELNKLYRVSQHINFSEDYFIL